MALIPQLDLAEIIVEKARSIGLPVTYSVKTPGDGACLYHSIAECLEHSGLLTGCYSRHNVHQLRLDVVDFVLNNWCLASDEPADFIQRWLAQQNISRQTYSYFRSLCNSQKRYGEYATELFIKGAAMLLQTPTLPM